MHIMMLIAHTNILSRTAVQTLVLTQRTSSHTHTRTHTHSHTVTHTHTLTHTQTHTLTRPPRFGQKRNNSAQVEFLVTNSSPFSITSTFAQVVFLKSNVT